MSAESHKSDTNNWLFVKIYTDTGVYGVGEGSLQYKDLGLIGEIQDFSKFLIGKDPFAIEYIWTSLYRRVTWTGGAVTMSAISAIDLALWDLKGKALGVPVYELLGGKVRDAVPVYANGWFENADTPSEHADAAVKTVKAGYPCLKFYPFKGEYVTTPDRINTGVDLVKAVREAVGPDIQIGIDIRARLDYWSAIQVVEELRPYKISWIEEPIQFDNPKLMGEFARNPVFLSPQGNNSTTVGTSNHYSTRELYQSSNLIFAMQEAFQNLGKSPQLQKRTMLVLLPTTLMDRSPLYPASTLI